MERRKLSEEEIAEKMAGLGGWKHEEGWLKKRFEFANFAESLAFVNRAGELAEAADHHPDIRMGWGYAEFELTTHDRGGLTDFDFELAGRIDAL
jgi:4a-hydroxytetrahydrobiopterin dehydratase